MNHEIKTTPTTEPRHAIAVVSKRSGLTQLVLRAWERRYGAVTPARTDTGRRLYSDEDLARLTLLKTLTTAGHRIGDVATRSLDALRTLAGELPPPESISSAVSDRSPRVTALLDQAISAVIDMNADALRKVLDEASLTISKPLLRNELIVPMLDGIGERWASGAIRVAHEHMASAVVKTFISGMNARHVPPPGAPVLVVATPSKHIHELGALLVTSQALDLGWEVLYLGVDLPAEEIAMGVRMRNADALYLSLIYPQADAIVSEQMLTIRRLVGPTLPILVSGRATESYNDTLETINAQTAADPTVLDSLMRHILNN